jgi:L-2-hydroxyglutarate oxidase LhgO
MHHSKWQLVALPCEDGVQAGAEVRTSTELVDAQPGTSGLDITTKERGTGGGAQASLQARWLVNSAGLRAHDIATRVAHLPEDKIPRIRFAKGNYFLAPGEHVFSRLVYPVPEDGGLGAHLTIDLDQNIKFGPDVEWLETNNADEINYQVDPARRERFLQSVGQFWPAIHNRDMVEGYSGVRAKLSGPGEPDADFLIHGPQEHGAQGYVGLYGIESPGLTSCMELGRLVDEMIA